MNNLPGQPALIYELMLLAVSPQIQSGGKDMGGAEEEFNSEYLKNAKSHHNQGSCRSKSPSIVWD